MARFSGSDCQSSDRRCCCDPHTLEEIYRHNKRQWRASYAGMTATELIASSPQQDSLTKWPAHSHPPLTVSLVSDT